MVFRMLSGLSPAPPTDMGIRMSGTLKKPRAPRYGIGRSNTRNSSRFQANRPAEKSPHTRSSSFAAVSPNSVPVGSQSTTLTIPISAPVGKSSAQRVPNSSSRIRRSGSSSANFLSKCCAAWTRSQPRCEHRQCRVSCTFRSEHQRLAHGCQRESALTGPAVAYGGIGYFSAYLGRRCRFGSPLSLRTRLRH